MPRPPSNNCLTVASTPFDTSAMPPTPPEPPREELRGLRVLAHPLRLRLLSLTTARAYSAAEAARELGATQANTSYHLRRLHEAGLLRLDGEETVRGGLAKRYRYDGSSRLTAGTEAEEYAAVASALGEESRRRSHRRDLRHPGSLTDAEVWLPKATWERVRELAEEIGELVHEEAVPADSPGAVPTSATLLLFRMADGQGDGE